MPMLMLSLDSLIAAAALSAAVGRRHYAPLALLFGACDLAASSVAPMLSAPAAASSFAPMLDPRLLAQGSLVPWLLLPGILILSGSARRTRSRKLQAVAYLLPPLFALDNLISAASPLPAGLISCAMAAAGFVLGAAVLNRRAPPAPRPLWAAGLTVLGIALQLAG